jgi:Predicted nucleotide-binding protein containing TIR-like domain
MKIAIIGSWRMKNDDLALSGTLGEFEAVCFDIGRELGRLHCSIIVSGEAPHTADLHVVRGMLDALHGQRVDIPLIEVARPQSDHNSYKELSRKNPGIFQFQPPSQTTWREVMLAAIGESSILIAIAGLRGTLEAGLAAMHAGKKVIPVSCFGGAAGQLSKELRNRPEYAAKHTLLGRLAGPWADGSFDVIAKLAGIGALPRVLLIHGRSMDWQYLKDWLIESGAVSTVTVMQEVEGTGLTIPEKFERLANETDLAIAIATPDDKGGLATEDPGIYKHRARQNVWIEVGWFWGRLGRNKVFILSKEGVEFPSDLSGIEWQAYSINPLEKKERLKGFLDGMRKRS